MTVASSVVTAMNPRARQSTVSSFMRRVAVSTAGVSWTRPIASPAPRTAPMIPTINPSRPGMTMQIDALTCHAKQRGVRRSRTAPARAEGRRPFLDGDLQSQRFDRST